jgi:CTP-dependent riboflavin kinase
MSRTETQYAGRVVRGAGGASRAFAAFEGRRIRELEAVVGYAPFPGTLNLRLDTPFDFEAPHLEGDVLHKAGRGKFHPRRTRLYPVSVDGRHGHVIRFEGAKYSPKYVGVIAAERLRDHVDGHVTLRLR